MDKQEGNKRKRKKSSSSLSSSDSGHTASRRAETLFALMLAAISDQHRNSTPSVALLKNCLHRLSLPLLSKTLEPFISLFPLLLHSRMRDRCAEIAIISLEILGRASLYSLEMNEKIASDDEIVKGLIMAMGIPEQKKGVVFAAVNAVLDLSTTTFARQRLLQFSALDYFIFHFNQVSKCSGTLVCVYADQKSSATSVKIGFKEDEYLILILHTVVTLINTCNVEQLEKIPRILSTKLLDYLKNLWAEIHKQMLHGSILEFSSVRQFYLSKIRPNDLSGCIFRLSINLGQLAIPTNVNEVKRSIFDTGETSFESFMLSYWEVSPLHIRRHSEATSNMFSPFKEFLRPGDVFPSFISPILQKFISSLPISSDELDILNFLEDVRDHLGCPLIYQQDIRVLKTQYSNREMHFFPEYLGSCFPETPRFLYINDILRCEEAYKEGYSIALRGMEFRFEAIAAIADWLASLFGQPSAGVNMYVTPPNSQGLARHCDDHCVLVCQLIGVKNWKVFPHLSHQLPRLYEPVNQLDVGSMKADGSTQILLREGDVLYIPRGIPHEACTMVSSDGSDGDTGLSLHLTLAIEVEPPFEWEGFTHVALHHWGQNRYLCEHTSADTLSWNLHVLAVNLMHFIIKTSGYIDSTFRKACLVGAISSPSVDDGWLDLNQKTTFKHLLNTVSAQARIVDALRSVEVALQKHEDPLKDIKWLQHLSREGKMLEAGNGNSPSIKTETFSHLVGQHMGKVEAAFVNVKSKFCSEVTFEDVVPSYKMLLEKYRMARKQYMNGMLSLNCN